MSLLQGILCVISCASVNGADHGTTASTLSWILEGTPKGALPDGPAKRNTPVCPLLAVCASVGDTNSNRLAGSFSSADPATRERYCKSASGRWKDAMPPATHRWFWGAAVKCVACCCACCLDDAGNKPPQENDPFHHEVCHNNQVCANRICGCEW